MVWVGRGGVGIGRRERDHCSSTTFLRASRDNHPIGDNTIICYKWSKEGKEEREGEEEERGCGEWGGRHGSALQEAFELSSGHSIPPCSGATNIVLVKT